MRLETVRLHSNLLILSRSQLPARATRLLSRRMQANSNSPLSQNGSDSPRSLDSLHSRNTPSKTSLREHLKQRQQLNLHSQLLNSSSEDLVLDKSLRNSMLQDVVCFKKQLVHLRRILQEVSRLGLTPACFHFITGYGFTHIWAIKFMASLVSSLLTIFFLFVSTYSLWFSLITRPHFCAIAVWFALQYFLCSNCCPQYSGRGR